MSKIFIGKNIGPGPQKIRVHTGIIYESYYLPHIARHSPDGFQWGYGGSGPADLARSILFDVLGEKNQALIDRIYQDFKWAFIAPAGQNLKIIEDDILEWIAVKKGEIEEEKENSLIEHEKGWIPKDKEE